MLFHDEQSIMPHFKFDVSALQRHTSYWDRNKDGIIFPHETYDGFRYISKVNCATLAKEVSDDHILTRALGFNMLISLMGTLGFHLVHVSYWTQGSWLPDPRFPVYVKRIHRAKHGSDTEVYDQSGDYDERRFKQIFERYDM